MYIQICIYIRIYIYICILGQLIGSASAYMITAPRGYVKGESVDDIMARTAYLLDHNLIPEALKELDNVTGI
jgi:hypothetical protein